MRVNARIHESEKDLLVVVVALLLFKKSCSSNLSKRVRIILCVLYKRCYVYVCVLVCVCSKLMRKSVRSVLLLRFRGFARGETCTRRNDDKQTPRHLNIYIYSSPSSRLSPPLPRERYTQRSQIPVDGDARLLHLHADDVHRAKPFQNLPTNILADRFD